MQVQPSARILKSKDLGQGESFVGLGSSFTPVFFPKRRSRFDFQNRLKINLPGFSRLPCFQHLLKHESFSSEIPSSFGRS